MAISLAILAGIEAAGISDDSPSAVDVAVGVADAVDVDVDLLRNSLEPDDDFVGFLELHPRLLRILLVSIEDEEVEAEAERMWFDVTFVAVVAARAVESLADVYLTCSTVSRMHEGTPCSFVQSLSSRSSSLHSHSQAS